MERLQHSRRALRDATKKWLVPVLLVFTPAAHAIHPMLEQLLESAGPATLAEWAERYEHGVTVRRDLDRALELYCRAATAGHANSQYQLGRIYASGLAGKVNEVLAAGWLHLAEQSGSRNARSALDRLGVGFAGRVPEPTCVLSGDLTTEVLARGSLPPEVKTVVIRDPNRHQVERLVRFLAPDYGLDPTLVLAVIEVESNFNPKALSPKNAQGLMQLIPQTAARFGVRDAWDPEQNVRGGMAYLRWLLEHFDGDVRLALAAYNAGENAVQRYGGVPPYPETRTYLRRIWKRLGRQNGA
jgi:hypothetical protein